ncbi:unnamed protein product [Peniophora sp. CBMAI 1063]|nr:unnamed protein product [Peniophora sp. CBMAI 1063]
MENGDTSDAARLWALLSELMEQTNQHRQFSAQLHSQASDIKTQAIHTQTGFVLRRFNLDKTKEEYDNELERMNVSIAAENVALQNDNKQLNALIREYESTLETLMDQFRNRAHEIQEHELSLIRHYESQLLEREDEALNEALAASSSTSNTLTQISQLLRQTLRAMQGEDYEEQPVGDEYAEFLADTTAPGAESPEWDAVARADWALERECELARLEDENRMLRRLLGEQVEEAHDAELFPPGALDTAMGPVREGERGMAGEDGRMSAMPTLRASRPPGPHMLGGPKGTVGPFGSYKRMRAGLSANMGM